jgi:Flp pilus assembly protein CpaB
MSSTKEDRRMQTIPAQKPRRPRKRASVDLRKLVSTRRGSALVAGVSALLATAVIMVFLHQYRQSLNAGKQEATVLVARNLIPKGSSGTVIAEKSIFQTAQVRKSDLKSGAVSDPSLFRGKVTSKDVYPGQQLVLGDFVPATGGVRDHITGTDRAISLPLDNSHGMIGDVQAGDHVDVFYEAGSSSRLGTGPAQNRSFVMPLLRNLLVLRAPAKAVTGGLGGANNSQVVVLRSSDAQAERLAYASDNGQIWLVLRARVGASNSKLPIIDERGLVISAAAAGQR